MKAIIESEVKVAGTYEFKVYNNGKLRKTLGPFKNLITNSGLDTYCTTGQPIVELSNGSVSAVIGTGTNPAAPTDTALQTQVAAALIASGFTNAYNIVAPGRWVSCQITYTFPVSAYVGTITEAGVRKYSGTDLFSRLVLPVPLTLVIGDQLTLTYRFYTLIPEDDWVGAASGYTITGRTLGMNSNIVNGVGWPYGTPYYTLFGFGSGLMDARAYESNVLRPNSEDVTFAGGFSETTADLTSPAYVPGSFERYLVWRWKLAEGNFATGVGRVGIRSSYASGQWQFSFTPQIPKTSAKILALTIRYKFTRGTPP